MKRRWTNRRHARCDRFRSAGRQPREFVPGGRSERYEVGLSWRPRDSRSPVAAFAYLAFDDVNEDIQTIVSSPRGFTKIADLLAQSTNLMSESIDLSLMYLGNAEQGSDAFCVSGLRFRQRINLCS